jgi:hypothetical protein
VCYQLQHSSEPSGSQFRAHLQNKDICYDNQLNPARLREAVLNDRYVSFLDNHTGDSYKSQIAQFRQSGQFATDFGDLILVAIANLLGSVLILLSSNPHLPYLSVTPETDIIPSVPLYLAFNCSGTGHYDGTKEKSTVSVLMSPEKNVSK